MRYYIMAFMYRGIKFYYRGANEKGVISFTKEDDNLPIFSSDHILGEKRKIRKFFNLQNAEVYFISYLVPDDKVQNFTIAEPKDCDYVSFLEHA